MYLLWYFCLCNIWVWWVIVSVILSTTWLHESEYYFVIFHWYCLHWKNVTHDVFRWSHNLVMVTVYACLIQDKRCVFKSLSILWTKFKSSFHSTNFHTFYQIFYSLLNFDFSLSPFSFLCCCSLECMHMDISIFQKIFCFASLKK